MRVSRRQFALPLFAMAYSARFPRLVLAQTPNGPAYAADTIANSAANIVDWYSSNSFISIYGMNLAFTTREITRTDIAAGVLPTALPGTGVRVVINSILAYVYYVSPRQVNVLIPSLTPGPATLQLEVNGIAGPEVRLLLRDTAPGLFTFADGATVIGVHGDWSLITSDAPARAGEEIVIFATGLGVTTPATPSGQIPQGARQIKDHANFKVWLNGTALEPEAVDYVGGAPGYAGVYQINITLPVTLASDIGRNPEVRISTGAVISPNQRFLITE